MRAVPNRPICRVFVFWLWAAAFVLCAAGAPLKVCLVSGSAEYKSDESLAAFQQYFETNYDGVCTRAFGEDKGNGLPGLEALDAADVMVLYTRRLSLPPEQMARVRKFLDGGKPLVGLRTASHAFQNWEPDVKALDSEVLGGSYAGHYEKDEPATLRFEQGDHPILKGIVPFTTTGKLYKNPQLARDVMVLVTAATAAHTEPVAWTRSRRGRVFYTSLGVPEDFKIEAFRQMLAQGVFWAANRPVDRKSGRRKNN
jgi:type 1 glutamine amidotransferase